MWVSIASTIFPPNNNSSTYAIHYDIAEFKRLCLAVEAVSPQEGLIHPPHQPPLSSLHHQPQGIPMETGNAQWSTSMQRLRWDRIFSSEEGSIMTTDQVDTYPCRLPRNVMLILFQGLMLCHLAHSKGCTEVAETSDCAIPISHVSLGTGSHYEKYDAWRAGDNFLDWYGAESNQGRWQNVEAEGTPSAWTTNDPGNDGYQPDNQ